MQVLQGRVAAVTGAAGGIGRAIALEFGKHGMDVALADVDEPGMQAVASELEGLGRRALCVPTDVTRAEALQNLLERTLAELGSCHVMVNNAGVFNASPMLDASDEQWQRVLDINLWGVIRGSRIFGKHFARQREGHLVNTASAAGLFPMPGMCSYTTTKYAIVGFTQQLRWELAASGVGVTLLCPGVVKTRISMAPGVGLEHVDMEKALSRAPLPEGLAKKVVQAVRKNRPLVRYGPDAYLFSLLRLFPSWLIDPLGRFMARRAFEVVTPPGTPKALPR
jgi:NAD(P)-dependent dehydrogenase (short-subunit alcohol dehydrogenase family)